MIMIVLSAISSLSNLAIAAIALDHLIDTPYALAYQGYCYDSQSFRLSDHIRESLVSNKGAHIISIAHSSDNDRAKRLPVSLDTTENAISYHIGLLDCAYLTGFFK
jgi:hypothetical protein